MRLKCRISASVNLIHRYRGPPVSLRVGHAADLTRSQRVIQYRVAASLPALGEGLVMLLLSFKQFRFTCSVSFREGRPLPYGEEMQSAKCKIIVDFLPVGENPP